MTDSEDREHAVTRPRAERSWDLERASLYGVVIGTVYSVIEHVTIRTLSDWSILEVIVFMIGRLSGLAVLFAGVALMRNAIAASRNRRMSLIGSPSDFGTKPVSQSVLGTGKTA